MKVIILGCGYLGYNLYIDLKKYYEVEVWGLRSYYSDKCENFKEYNIFKDISSLGEKLEDSIIIDCISLVATTEEDINKIDYIRSIYSNLFLALEEAKIKRFICLSSGGTIYGNSYVPISEDHILNPDSVYAKSKYTIEKLLLESKLNHLILRPTNPYGGEFEPNKQQGVISILINKVLKNEEFNIWTGLDTARDYIYISDFTRAIISLINKNTNNEIVNISSGKATTLKEVIDIIEENTHKKIKLNKIQIGVPVVKSIVLSNDKLKKLTDFEVEVSLEEGIKKEIERIRSELKI